MPAVGWEGLYEVSDQGRVRSVERRVHYTRMGFDETRRVPARIKKPTPHPLTGHLYVHLYRNNVRSAVKVHHLVLVTFVGPCPPGMEGCHANDVADDNRLENLRWDTHIENCKDRSRNRTPATHCGRNHEFTQENTMRLKGGKRRCRKCHNETQRSGKRRAREAA